MIFIAKNSQNRYTTCKEMPIMNKKSGFTLIELLTVVLILGILTAIALPQYQKTIQRTEAANALINLRTIFDSAKRFYASNSQWPTSFTGLDVDLFDVSPEGNMGEFQYTFSTNNSGTVSACRLIDGAADNSFCLRAARRKVAPTTGNNKMIQRDVYTCLPAVEKFQAVCDSLCSTESTVGSECYIN